MNFQEDVNQIFSINKQCSFVPEFLNTLANAELFLVGGSVRDMLIKRTMREIDFDFVVRGLTHEEIQAWFETKGTLDFTGKQFGVFKFMPNGFNSKNIPFIDIALPRTEQSQTQSSGGYKEFDVQSDPTLPIKDDLSRRDFTINAMAINLQTGELIDLFGGQQDLNEKEIKAVGNPDDRFREDLSRMLRAIRFASELNFAIEPNTLEAIHNHIQKIQTKENGEYIISRETVGLELAKALSGNPSAAGVWLEISGALKALMPEVQPNAIERLQNVSPGNAQLAITLLLCDLSSEQAKNILLETGLNSLPKHSTLRIDVDTVLWGIDRLHEAVSETWIQGMRAHKFEKCFMNGHGAFLFSLLEHTEKHAISKLAQERKSLIEKRWLIEPYEHIPTLVSGDDVLTAHTEPGPRIRQILEHIRDEQLEGKILTREQAMKILKNQNEVT